MEYKMSRFYVDNKRWVINRANWANSRLYRIWAGEVAWDEEHLRESVLLVRLERLLGQRHGPSAPKRDKRGRRRRRLEKALLFLRDVLIAVGASHMSEQSAARLHHHKFNDQLRRENEHFGEFTSPALFLDDIELLMRDLYGDFEQSAARAVRHALYTVLRGCLRSLPKDIWNEQGNAKMIDHGWYGVGLAPGDGISTHALWQGDEAANDLARRVRAFRANPKAYSKYTHQFVHILDERWPKFDVQDHHFYPTLKAKPVGKE
jgi:hypothetical protein